MKKLLFATIIGMFMMSCNDSEVNPAVDDNVDPGFENVDPEFGLPEGEEVDPGFENIDPGFGSPEGEEEVDPGFDNVDPGFNNPGDNTTSISE
ncbi:hypothetical protein [Flammeovirga sp. SubArs3]|uniref:hypothetical protein n=1 Tax=Flammeovirga sp. SubArs3 TaxID=2995316 RepID=UPI00248B18FD|nr:hypothetical protein [Flammeovirga sp. SubArs3]